MKPHVLFCITAITLLFLINVDGHASTKATPESIAIQDIRAAIEGFAESNLGRAPTNWGEIGQFVDLNEINRKLRFEANSSPIQAHYVFVPKPFPMLVQRKGAVVLIRCEPIEHPEAGLGRYVVSRRTNEFLYSWLPESEVQEMLSKGRGEIPSPDSETIRVARLGVEKALANDEQIRRAIRRIEWQQRWECIKDWFIAPASTNANIAQASPSTLARIRPIPVALAVLLASGMGILVFRAFARRKKPE